MRRKDLPKYPKRRACRKKNGESYILSNRAQQVLTTVLEGIIEESLEEAKNLATLAGKNRVTLEEMEKALRQLCMRLNNQITMQNKRNDETRDIK